MKTISAEEIRPLTVAMMLLVSLTLIQTPIMHIGAIIGACTLGIVLICLAMESKDNLLQIRLNAINKYLLIFLYDSFIITLIYAGLPSDYFMMAVQILCCVLVSQISLNKREIAFIRNAFVIAIVLYALLIIRSCLTTVRYYHGDVPLFGTSFDPNYLGLPLVAGINLLVDDILQNRKPILHGIMAVIVVIAVMYTASRGSLLTMALGCSLNLFSYIFFRKDKIWKKVIWVVIIILFIVFAIGYMQTAFSLEWERMTSFGENADNGRFDLWRQAVQIWSRHPIFGYGFDTTMRVFSRAAHNTYLQLSADFGLVGMFLMTMAGIGIIKRAIRCETAYFVVFVSMLFQLFFLDGMDARCVWALCCWFSMLPEISNNRRLMIKMK